MLRTGILVVVLVIVPGYSMPVQDSVYEANVMFKAQPETSPQPPPAMNVFEDHVFLRKKREAENVFEDHFIMNKNNDPESTVAEDNIMMNQAPIDDGTDSTGAFIVEDNIMMRQENIFEDNIAMKQDSADQGNSVYEDNIMLRNEDVSQDSKSNSMKKPTIIEDDIAMRGDGKHSITSSPENAVAREHIFEDNVMMKNNPNKPELDGSSNKASQVFEDHVIMREDASTTTASSVDSQNTINQKAFVFEDNIIMRSDSGNGVDSPSQNSVIENNIILRDVADTTTTRPVDSQDEVKPKDAIFEDDIIIRSDPQTGVDSMPAENSLVTEDHVILRSEQNDPSQNDGSAAAQTENNNQNSLIIIEDHLLRKRRESNSDAIIEEHVMIRPSNGQSTTSSPTAKQLAQKSSIIIEDHLIR